MANTAAKLWIYNLEAGSKMSDLFIAKNAYVTKAQALALYNISKSYLCDANLCLSLNQIESIGDSISRGDTNSNTAYQLHMAGLNKTYQFVGPGNTSIPAGTFNHCASGGSYISTMAARLTGYDDYSGFTNCLGYLSDDPAIKKTVLILAGTIDIESTFEDPYNPGTFGCNSNCADDCSESEEQAIADAIVNDLVAVVRSTKPFTDVYVGSILPRGYNQSGYLACNADATAINIKILTGLQACSDFNNGVYFVNLADGFDIATMIDPDDGVHPNSLGNQFIAGKWVEAINQANSV
jgi:lysophospholipase L1-like esterase